MVRIVVDQSACLGVGQCEFLAPEVFALDDDDGLVQLIGSPEMEQGRAEQLVDRCPSGALSVEGGPVE
jgi:ferredoxin